MADISGVLDVFSTVYTCLSGDVVGAPVYLVSADTVTTADGTNGAKMPAIGLISSKPTTTTCIVQYGGEFAGLSGLTAGTTYYVGAAGALTSSTAGLVTIQSVGFAKDTTTLVMATPSIAGSQSITGNLAVSGNLSVGGNSGFYGTSPVAQPANTVDARHALQTLGLIASGGDGIPSASPVRLPLTLLRNLDYTVMDATGGVGKFSLAGTVGTSTHIVSEQASNNTKTDDILFELVLPFDYVAASNLTLTINVQRTVTGATGLVTSLNPQVYLMSDAGVAGANLGPGSSAYTSATQVDVPFVITGATLTPGARLLVDVTAVVTAGAGTTAITQINSIRLS